MEWLERLLLNVFPTLRLQSTSWLELWTERERRSILIATRITGLLAGIAFIAHHWAVDLPLQLSPPERWMAYRFGVGGVCIAAALLTWLPRVQTAHYYRWGLLSIGAVSGYFQAKSMTWFDGVPYAYAIIIPAISVLLARDSALRSAGYLVAVYAAQWHFFVEAHTDMQFVVSAALVSIVVVTMFRVRMVAEVAGFVAEQEKLQAQKDLIESQMELNQEIKAFLPAEIYERVIDQRTRKKTTVLQAMDEALRPRLKTVACILSDIRGFTQKSRDLHGFIFNGALPNIRICTETVEAYRGIPRLIGDAVIAYFDDRSPEALMHDSLACGFALIEANRQWNASTPPSENVRRFVILTFGEAVVGNIGGQDSSREITALGPPINLASRLDPVTKEPALAELLGPESLILSRTAADAARFCVRDLHVQEISLVALGIDVRDFPEETSIFLVPCDTHNMALLSLQSTKDAEEVVPATDSKEYAR